MSDTPAVMQVLRSKSFTGRPNVGLNDETFAKPVSISIVTVDPSPGWEVLRKVSYSAVRRTAVSPILPEQAVYVIEQVAEKMIRERKTGIDAGEAVGTTTLALLAILAFGRRFRLEDDYFRRMQCII